MNQGSSSSPATVVPLPENSQGVGGCPPSFQQVAAKAQHTARVFQIVGQSPGSPFLGRSGHQFQCFLGDFHPRGETEQGLISIGGQEAEEQGLGKTGTTAGNDHEFILALFRVEFLQCPSQAF